MSVPGPRAALLTARGRGGVAVLSLHGPERFDLVARLVDGALVDAVPRLRWITLAGERIDQAVVFARPEQASIEVHLHGSMAVVRALERELGPMAAPPPTVRERLLLTSASLAQLDFALEQALLLAPFDASFARFVQAHAQTPAALREALAGYPAARALISPFPLVLIGRKNAGKSTLMNRLLFRERVLTGPTPGLTRDPVCETLVLDGYPYELVDTAGEGVAVDALDRDAIARGRAARAGATPILVVDAAVGIGALERDLIRRQAPLFAIRTKSDLPAAAWPPDLAPPLVDVACKDADGAARVRADVGAVLRGARGLPPAGPCGVVVALDADEAALVRALLDALPS